MISPRSHPLVELARRAISEYLDARQVIGVPASFHEAFPNPSGVFVCLKKNGQLRGCVGTYEPTQPSVAAEVIQNAIASATKDPRFIPLTATELGDIDCSVDVLSRPMPAMSRDWDPRQFGVLVVRGSKRGLLLPDLDGIRTAEEQIRMAKEKAGIFADEEAALYRFDVQRYR